MSGPALGVLVVLGCVALVGCQKPIMPGDPLRNLNQAERATFDSGRVTFDEEFTPETGLGPLFNSVSCGECHEDPASGGTGDEVELHASAFHPPLCDPLVGEGGFVIQLHTTPALKTALGIDSEPFPPSATNRASRTTPVLFGRGLLDLVPDSVILSYADSADANGDGISGRPGRFLDGRLGRFGRKGIVPTLDEFNDGAYAAEMGITSPAVPTEETVGGKPIPAGVDPVPEPEIPQLTLDRTNAFVRFLAPPTPLKANKAAKRGRQLFGDIGCAACHIPTLTTGPSPVVALNRQVFQAYTDLLLHDMGPDLADMCLGETNPAEFRTEPLVGLRVKTNFLHDGRDTTIDAAIRSHGGEAARARDGFLQLSAEEQAAVVAFLKTL